MDPITMAAIMATLGLAKSQLIDGPQAARDAKLAAATQRYSPWTGLKASPVKEADPMGAAMQGGVGGAMLGQNMQNADIANKQTQAMTRWLDHGGSPAYPAMASGITSRSMFSAPNYGGGYSGSPWGLF